MRSVVLSVLAVLLFSFSYSQDTIVVQTFTFDSTGRSGIFQFPDEPGQSFEKIILQYTMRCHDALIGNGNVGCWEWDYSNHTVLVDSSQTDSLFTNHPSHVITNSNSNPYYYIEEPSNSYFQYLQQDVTYTNVISEEVFNVGNGSGETELPFQTSYERGRTQFLWTADELSAAGLTEGDITGLKLDISDLGDEIEFLKIKMKHTDITELDKDTPDMDGFTEVYFLDTPINLIGEHQFNFYEVFEWDGTSNIIVEFSFTNTSGGNNNECMAETMTSVKSISTHSNDGFLSLNYGDYIDVPADVFETVDSAITVSFWQYGDIEINPHNSYIFEGGNDANQRVINCHLPWSNGNVYWDAGNSGTSSYDRIYSGANFSDYAGKWNHWAMTKNVHTGVMNLYLNGELWLTGVGKTRTMEGITRFIIGGNKNFQGRYDGYLNEFRVWNTGLDAETIKSWMHSDVDSNHPNWDKLILYYKFDEECGSIISDSSPTSTDATLVGADVWSELKGHQLLLNFEESILRPNVVFIRGEYDQSVEEIEIMDSLQNSYNIVYDYYVENNNLIPNDTNTYWEAGYMNVWDEANNIVDSIYLQPVDSIIIETLEYYQKTSSKFKLVSFVTPYGNGLDLGIDGKMWEFDLTDFSPVLKGEKLIRMQGGGQWSEEFDLRFLFIEGTPPRDVLSIQNIWPVSFSAAWISAILEDRRFEPRMVYMNPDAVDYKIRTIVTGHHQDGEFIAKRNFLNVEDEEFEFLVWNECSTIPIYPQGGTWIYDRAGWCPGDPSTLWEFDITDLVIPGDSAEINYGMKYYPSVVDAVYIVSNQLVSYGEPNFNLDAAVKSIGKPNNSAAFERFNPACMNPVVCIQNTGAEELTSLDIEYFVDDGQVLTYNWTGSLGFLDTTEITLPVTEYSFWSGSSNHFNVNISNPNGGLDEYPNNNTYRISYDEVDMYDDEQVLILECKTNNYGFHTTYSVTDAEGNIILERSDLDNNTIYTDELDLSMGCYKIRINDAADDGLYWWHSSTQGTGYFKLKTSGGASLKTFEPEFGRFMEYEFSIADITGVEESHASRICSIYPNPTTGPVSIELLGYNNEDVHVQVLSNNAAILHEETIRVSASEFNTELDLSDLKPGVYILQLITEKNKIVRKLVKQ